MTKLETSSLVNLERACEILSDGGVVAIPTETVYGLAARIDKPKGLEKIFYIKERPFFDPLIVHVQNAEQAQKCSKEWFPICETLAQYFWPGPLTLVIKKNELTVSDVITSGQDSVGLRCPNHPLAQEILKSLGVPLAAPSANKFKKVSPTCADHVLRGLPGVPVLDGGDCQEGIESTILKVEFDSSLNQYQLQILRPGNVSRSQIAKVTQKYNVVWLERAELMHFPGSEKEHYRPEAPLFLVKSENASLKEIFEKLKTIPVSSDFRISQYDDIEEVILPDTPVMAARILYSELQKMSQNKNKIRILRWKPYFDEESGKALLDRLTRASQMILEL